jgi:hypothetical protein
VRGAPTSSGARCPAPPGRPPADASSSSGERALAGERPSAPSLIVTSRKPAAGTRSYHPPRASGGRGPGAPAGSARHLRPSGTLERDCPAAGGCRGASWRPSADHLPVVHAAPAGPGPGHDRVAPVDGSCRPARTRPG